MIHAILSQRYRTLVNEGNYNNELGLPLTLFGLNGQHQRVVLEMGAGKPGDIHYLMQIARPRVGVLNNASAAHLERMGSVEEVARTKGAIVSELPPDGTAIFNADDDYASMWSQMAGGRRQWTFGLDRPAAFTCTHRQVDGGRELKISGPDGFSCETLLRVPGLHNVSNALAATAAAVAAGADEAMVAAALSEFRVVAGRQQMMAHASGACLIKDTYNANPASLAAGIATLVDMSGEPWLILGDMGELGENEAGLHFDAGRQARRAGVSRLYAVGRLTAHTVAGFGPGAHHFDDKRALAEAVRAELRSGIVCLVKGSRAARMEEVVDMLMEERS